MKDQQVTYRLCPQCGRAVPVRTPERHCPNDGALLLQACPACQTAISSPYARYCTGCGIALMRPLEER